jgi:hypothetical protein
MEEKCYDQFLQEMTLYVRASYEKATGKVLGEHLTAALNDLLDVFFQTKFESSSPVTEETKVYRVH